MNSEDPLLLKELLENEKRYLNYFFEHIDYPSFEKIFDVLESCTGIIGMTGVGKSGLVAKKIAATMTSTNSRAIYISPVDALHGDLGIVKENDVFMFFSKSGESEELLNLVPILRNKGVPLIAAVSNMQSRLAKACDYAVNLPLERELCPFNMAPTTSTVIQMIFGDAMAIALMKKRGFTIDDFGLNHPAGRIGKRINLKVKDLMITGNDIPKCAPHDKLIDTLVELSNKRCGCVLVLEEDNTLKGIFTDGDLRRTLLNTGAEIFEKKMKDVMTENPRSISSNTLLVEAVRIMENSFKNEVTVLPVVDQDNRVNGLIKLHDIIQAGI